ncbi:MAG: hypothetical protein IKM88_12265 [Lachnospiraceae bacterium]|nr:hypothetical protein [Lachnospiraceae bacterium]
MRKWYVKGNGQNARSSEQLLLKNVIKKFITFAMVLYVLCGNAPEVSAGFGNAVAADGVYLVDDHTVTVLITAGKTEWSKALGKDGSVEIYALAPFENAVPKDRMPVAKVMLYAADWAQSSDTITKRATFVLPENGLYRKYAVGGKYGVNLQVKYICNPELLATHTKERIDYPAKLPEGMFANYHIDLKQYSDSYVLGTAKIVQFNNYGTNPVLRHPLADAEDIHAPWEHDVDKQPFQYMMNASDPDGIAAMAKIMHEVASNGPGQDYIIGNEVNVRKWCYISYVDEDQYIREYMQVFRVAYNAIKSADANARVFICLDHDWNRDHPEGDWERYCVIDSRDFLIRFNEMIREEGNIGWGLAYHPHLAPLTNAKFWDNSEPYRSLIDEDRIVTVQNLSVVTDLLKQEEFLDAEGKVRSVMATEVTYSANQGADVQGAAVYAAYVSILRNPYVETIVINQYPQEDIDGIFTPMAQYVYDNMDGPAAYAYDVWAKQVIGITDWGQILR